MKIFVCLLVLCNAQQRIMFLSKEHIMPTEKIDFYRYPKEVSCEFTNGTKKRLILEKLVGDSLIFRKYYNQKNYDCTMASIKSLHVIEKKYNENVLMLPYQIKCFFKDGTKQNMILQRIKGDSLFLKKENDTANKAIHNNTIEAIRILKNNHPIITASATTIITIANVYVLHYFLTSEKFDPRYAEDITIRLMLAMVKLLSFGTTGLSTYITVEQYTKMTKNLT